MATDAELMQLAEQATPGGASHIGAVDSDPLNGGDYGNPIPPQPGAGPGAMGLDLSGITGTVNPNVNPNGPPVAGPVEMPGDRDLGALGAAAPTGAPVSQINAPPALSGPPTNAQAGVALEQARQAELGAARAQEAVAPIKADMATAAAEGQGKVAEQAKANEVELRAEKQAQDDGLEKARTIASQAEDEFKNFKFHDYWEGVSTGDQILARLSMALGGFNARVNGGHNIQAEAIDRAIDRDFAQQKAQLSKAEVFAKWKKEGVKDLEGQYQTSLGTLKLAQAAATNATAEEAKQMILARGGDLAAAENNVLVQGLAAKAQQQYAGGLEVIAKAQAQVSLERAQLGVSRMNAQTARLGLEEKNDAKKAAAADKADKEIVRDEAGKPIGHVPTGRGGAQGFAARDADYGRAEKQLDVLIKDVEENGARVAGLSKIKARNSNYANAIGAVAGTSPLGKTDESVKLEKQSIGSSGAAGLNLDVVTGANLEALKQKAADIREQRARYRAETLIPLADGSPTTGNLGSVPSVGGGGGADRLSLAKQALQDPDAPPVAKARAKEILLQAAR